MKYKLLLSTILIITLFYAYFITPSQTWNSDYALYLILAKNLVQNKPYKKTNVVFNENRIMFPEYYPVIFPLLLTLPLKLFGINFIAFKYLNLFFLTLSLIVTGIYIYQKVGKWEAILSILLIANVYTFFFITTNVMSDVVFMFFVFISLFLQEIVEKKESKFILLLLGITWMLALGTRSIGIILPISFYAYIFIRKKLNYKLIIPVIPVIIYLLFEKVLLGANTLYWKQLLNTSPEMWINNIISYSKTFFFFLFYKIDFLHIKKVFAIIIFLLTITGVFYKIRKYKISSADVFFLLYLIAIILWPSEQGFRMLFPVLMIFTLYLTLGIKKLKLNTKVIIVIFLSVYSVSYYYAISEIKKVRGPLSKEAKEIFNYIKKLPENSVIMFEEPRSVALFTGRRSIAFDYNTKANEKNLLQFTKKYGVNYILLSKDFPVYSKNIKPALNNNWEKVYENKNFQLYKFKE